jgi:acyl-CoA synthetase (AMP-forming)/AMP-acid ligase II
MNDIPVTTLVELLAHRSQYQPHQTALSFIRPGSTDSEQCTYQELHLQAQTIAAHLQQLNAINQRALLIYPTGLEFVAAFLGCLYAGVIAVPVCAPKRNQTLHKLQLIAADCQATLLLTTERFFQQTLKQSMAASDDLTGLRRIATDELPPDLAIDWQYPNISAETLAFLQYTSGSTGNPKGVMVNHHNLLHNSALIYQKFAHSAASQGVIWLPHYHDMGLIGGIVQPLYGGFPSVLLDPIDFLQQPFRWLQAISTHRATTSGGPNFAYDLCVRRITPEQRSQLDLSCWTVAFNGAEPIQADVLNRFAEAFAPCGFQQEAFYPCYGMAETTLLVTGGTAMQPTVFQAVEKKALEQNCAVSVSSQNTETTSRILVGCGKIAPGLSLKIVNPDTFVPCGINRVGEIWIAGDSVAQGYWQNPEQTQKTFHGYTSAGEGPFLRTGDLGFLREDGELFVTGRVKDMMIIRGCNHYPQDIEHTVGQSNPALRVGCGAAFSVEIAGQDQLVVVQEVERNYLRKLNVQEVIRDVRQALVREHGLYAHSVVLIKTATLPKTSSGKVQRHLCRSQFLAGTLETLAEPVNQPVLV